MAPKKQNQIFNTAGEIYTEDGIEGEGGTSSVYRVVDSEGKHWALKCLKPEQATSSRTKRFLNELNFCTKPYHQNIVRVLDQGFETRDGRKCPFYLMPLYKSTLRKIMKAGCDPKRVMFYFSKILDGVEAAHLLKVWHRDLKPENILHDPGTDELVVSDFGIAHFTEDAMHTVVETKPHERLANFQYAAPEQRSVGGIVDSRADIFALGLILNEMFTGSILQGTGFKQIGQVSADFAYLDEVVSQMVQHSPDNRPQSIDEIKKILIGRKNDFISRQKVDELRQIVVPSTSSNEPLIESPPKIIDVNIRGESLEITLSQNVNARWITAYNSVTGISYYRGLEPANWKFSGPVAIARPPRHLLDQNAQQIVDTFKQFVAAANVAYRRNTERDARTREEAEREALKKQIADEEWRRGVRGKIKF